VPEYWIVDIDGGVVERWRPGDDRPEVLDREMSWAPAEGTPLVIDIVALFAGLA
jgi:Uma2 family endonuclease